MNALRERLRDHLISTGEMGRLPAVEFDGTRFPLWKVDDAGVWIRVSLGQALCTKPADCLPILDATDEGNATAGVLLGMVREALPHAGFLSCGIDEGRWFVWSGEINDGSPPDLAVDEGGTTLAQAAARALLAARGVA